MKHLFFLANFATFLSSYFWICSPELVGYFVKIIRNERRNNIVLTPSDIFDSSDSNEKFWLGKQKIEDFKNLKYCLDL